MVRTFRASSKSEPASGHNEPRSPVRGCYCCFCGCQYWSLGAVARVLLGCIQLVAFDKSLHAIQQHVSQIRTSKTKMVKPTRAIRMGPAKPRARLVVSSSASTLQTASEGDDHEQSGDRLLRSLVELIIGLSRVSADGTWLSVESIRSCTSYRALCFDLTQESNTVARFATASAWKTPHDLGPTFKG